MELLHWREGDLDRQRTDPSTHRLTDLGRIAVVNAAPDSRIVDFLYVVADTRPAVCYARRRGACHLYRRHRTLAELRFEHFTDRARSNAVCARIFRMQRRIDQREPSGFG